MRIALGFGWMMWRRGRTAYFFALTSALLTYVLSVSPFAPYAIGVGSVYFASSALAMLGAFAFADATDLAALASGYPKHLFLLPVRSTTLAVWPMLIGALAVATAWATFAGTALWTHFGLSAVVLPALGLVALITGLQAASWIPLPIPFVRSLLVLVIVGGAAAWGLAANPIGPLSPIVVGVGYVAAWALAFGMATRGIAQARRGAQVEWKMPASRRRELEDSPDLPPFRSPMQSQVWIELRRNGLTLPILSGFLALLYALPTLLAGNREPLTLGAISYDRSLQVYFLPILIMVAVSSFDGGCGSVRDNFREDFSLITLLATRPLSDAGLVEAKIRMTTFAVLRSLAILAIGPILLLLSGITVAGNPTTVGAYLIAHATPRGVAFSLFLPLILFLAFWRGAVSSMWIRLTHQTWLRNGVGVAVPSLLFALAPFAGFRLLNDPHLWPTVLSWALPFLAFLATLKLVAACVVARKVRTLDLIPARTQTRWLAAALTAGLFMFLTLVLTGPPLPISRLGLALGIFLLLPLVRVQLAVLTMYGNRHR